MGGGGGQGMHSTTLAHVGGWNRIQSKRITGYAAPISIQDPNSRAVFVW